VAGVLAEALGLPAVAINDVHAAALAESQRGAGAGFERVLMTTVGTGVGGAFVHDGALDTGRTGSAGSLGHIRVAGVERVCSCGAVGHAEAVASGPGMERTFRELDGENAGVREIAILARAGDPIARAAIEEGAAALGRALVSAATVYDPSVIVIGGGVSELGGLLFDPAIAVYRAESLAVMRDIPILPAALGVSATVIGAALAMQRFLAETAGAPTRTS
jgi:glucokinase